MSAAHSPKSEPPAQDQVSPSDPSPASVSGVFPKGKPEHNISFPPPLRTVDIVEELKLERAREQALLIIIFYLLYKPTPDAHVQARQALREGIDDLMEDSEKKIDAINTIKPHLSRVYRVLAKYGNDIYTDLLIEFKDSPALSKAIHTLRTIF